MDLEKLQSAQPDVRVGFVLTREGRAWTEEALAGLTDALNQKFPPKAGIPEDSGILWEAGIQLNDPGFMAAMLRKRPDAFVVISLPDSSVILDGSLDADAAMAGYLEANKDGSATSWSLLASMYAGREG